MRDWPARARPAERARSANQADTRERCDVRERREMRGLARLKSMRATSSRHGKAGLLPPRHQQCAKRCPRRARRRSGTHGPPTCSSAAARVRSCVLLSPGVAPSGRDGASEARLAGACWEMAARARAPGSSTAHALTLALGLVTSSSGQPPEGHRRRPTQVGGPGTR